MYDQFKDLLGLSRKENKMAVEAAYTAFDLYNARIRQDGRKLLDQLVENNQLGIVVLGRTYHNDPGINHGIFKEFQTLKYPILTLDSMPMDDDLMEEIFGEDIRAGIISNPFDISDVWKHSMNENSNLKVWAAKFVARHPNLVGLEISSFKCGHDAPTYHLIEQIVEQSGTPYFSFKDIDENKSAGSIRLRVETLDYFLREYWDNKIKQNEASFEMAEIN